MFTFILKRKWSVSIIAAIIAAILLSTAEAGWKTKVAAFVGVKAVKHLVIHKGKDILASRAKVAGFEALKGRLRNNPWLASKAESALAKTLNSKAVRDKFSPAEIAQLRQKFEFRKWSQQGADTIVKRYFDDIEAQTGRAISKKQRGMVWHDMHKTHPNKLSVQDLDLARKQFGRKKEGLIKQWEKESGSKWPTEPSGNKYDAHHIIELNVGGKNEWWNLTPAKNGIEHQGGIHRSGGVASNLREIIAAGIRVVP